MSSPQANVRDFAENSNIAMMDTGLDTLLFNEDPTTHAIGESEFVGIYVGDFDASIPEYRRYLIIREWLLWPTNDAYYDGLYTWGYYKYRLTASGIDLASKEYLGLEYVNNQGVASGPIPGNYIHADETDGRRFVKVLLFISR